MDSDVLVIGAGVLGVGVSYHLTRLGLNVILLERESTIGSQASGKNAGMLRQLYHHPQLSDWALRTIRTMPTELRARSFQQTGSCIVGREKPGHHDELFEARSLSTSFGELPTVCCASDGLLDPGTFVQGLYSLAPKRHLHLKLRTEVRSIANTSYAWEVETTDGQTLSAPWLVNAAGAWINSFLGRAPQLEVAAEPFARHLYVTSGWPKNYMPAENCGFYWDETSGWYLRQWSACERLVSICDRIPAKPEAYSPAAHLHEALAEKLLAALPVQAPALSVAQSWHCFRTYTEDQLPIWGEDPAAPGLFWLAAFGGLGMSTGFAATFDAAQVISGQRKIALPDFALERVRKTGSSPGQKLAL